MFVYILSLDCPGFHSVVLSLTAFHWFEHGMNVPLAHVFKAWSSAAGAILGGWQELKGPSCRR